MSAADDDGVVTMDVTFRFVIPHHRAHAVAREIEMSEQLTVERLAEIAKNNDGRSEWFDPDAHGRDPWLVAMAASGASASDVITAMHKEGSRLRGELIHHAERSAPPVFIEGPATIEIGPEARIVSITKKEGT